MNNYKVKVDNEAESKEVQELFFALGAKWAQQDVANLLEYRKHLEVIIYKSGVLTHASKRYADDNCKDCLVLSVEQLNHLVSQQNIVYTEYLVKTTDGWILQQLDERLEDTDTCKKVPSGAECLTEFLYGNDLFSLWWKGTYKICIGYDEDWFNIERDIDDYLEDEKDARIVWKRHTKPEELPLINDETKPSLNDQYAEIEKVRQDAMNFNWLNSVAENDNVNHPSHYASGAVECIDAIESSMSVEAFRGYCKGNVQKYVWRYEDKGGKESLEKAQWYLNRLLGTFE